MAEALALVGLVSSIVQFVSFGTTVVTRLLEFQEKTSKTPQIFQDISTRLPLLLNSLKRIEAQANAGQVDVDTRQALQPVIEGCLTQVQQLDEILDKVVPLLGDSTWRRGTKALLSVNQENKVQKIGDTLVENIQLLTLHQVSGLRLETTKPIPLLFSVPYERDPKFVGRRAVIDEISQKFKVQRRVAIAGLGGVGKSQIAIEYCYVFKEMQPDAQVFWIHCSTRERLEQAYREISRKLTLPGWDDPKTNVLQLVFEWFSEERNGQWLLVIDNADDASAFFVNNLETLHANNEHPKALSLYLPHSSKGLMLITTRDKRVGERLANREKAILITPMVPSEAKTLLRSMISKEIWSEAEANELVKELAFLPLAITQAAAFMSENNDTISEYLNILHAEGEDMKELLSENQEDHRRDLYTENSVMRTWKLSFDQISKEKPRAAEILSLMAVLDRHGVPRMLVRKESETEIRFKTALGILQAFSLITIEKGKDAALTMHRLVQLSTQRWLSLRGDLEKWLVEALSILVNKYPSDAMYGNWPIFELLNPHAQVLLSHTFSSEATRLGYAKLLGSLASYENEKGRYFVAKEENLRSLTIFEKMLPEHHPLILERFNTFGEILLNNGEMEESRAFFQRAMLGREKVFGVDALETLESVNGLAYVSMRLYDLDTAEAFAQRALIGRTKLLGSENIYTCDSLRILGLVRGSKGDNDAAIESYQEVIRNQRPVLGPEHPDVLITVTHLALALAEQGELDTAEGMMQSTLSSRRKLLGDNHQSTLQSEHNLADMACQKGDVDRAKKLFQALLEKRERILGVEHIATVQTVDSLAEIALVQEQDISVAEELYRRALAGYEKALGPDHPYTLMALHQLAKVLLYLGRFKESEELGRRVVLGHTKLFGKDHFATLKSLFNTVLAIRNHRPDEFEEAEMICRRLITGSEKNSDQEYRGIELSSLQLLQHLLDRQNKQEETEEITDRISKLRLQLDGDVEDTVAPSSCEEATTTTSESEGISQEALSADSSYSFIPY